MVIWTRWARLPVLAIGACGVFAATLALVLTRTAPVPREAVVAVAAVALALTFAAAIRSIVGLARGPALPFDAVHAVRCDPAGAERVRARALRRAPDGGSGYLRPWAAAFPALAWVALCGVLASGLLNVTMRVEGRWIGYADAGRDLDVRQTYRDLDLGLFADPRDLRYGVLVHDVRPTSPSRLADVEIVDATGRTVASSVLDARGSIRLGGMVVYPWSYGPSLHVTLLHKDRGRLLDEVVPLWPTDRVGRYAERLESDGLALVIAVEGWPWPEGTPGDALVKLWSGERVLFDGPVAPRKAYAAKDDYGVIVWEMRPYVGLGVAHRTYRGLTLWSLGVFALAMLGAVAFPSRPFAYVEEPEGGVAVFPPAAWAKLSEGA